MLFWRSSQKGLGPIDEGEGEEGEEIELQRATSGSSGGGLPPGAVAVDVDGSSTLHPSRNTSIAADMPLLEHSPPPILTKPPTQTHQGPSSAASPSPVGVSPAPAPSWSPPGMSPRPAGAASPRPASINRPHASPLPPPSKLVRLRSLALEAAGAPQGLPQRSSNDSERPPVRRTSLGSRAGGEGPFSVGSREPSLAAAGVRGLQRALPLKRSTSLQSRKPSGDAPAAAALAQKVSYYSVAAWLLCMQIGCYCGAGQMHHLSH